jgi:tetratricopeptide (TPR) repeat protein
LYNHAKAEPLYLKALEISRRARGEEHPDTLRSMNDLGSLYTNQGQFAKAEPLLVKVLEISRRVQGESPNTLMCMNNLGSFYWTTGKLDRSIPLFQEALKRRQAKSGPDHPNTLLTMTNLGVNYRDAGRLPEGIALLEQAWARARKQPDPRVNNLGWMGTRLGEAYEQAGQLAKAESLYREGLEAARKRDGEASLPSADVLGSLGLNLLKQQRYADAEPLLRKCLMIREKNVPDDWKTLNTKSLLGGSLLGQGRYAAAEPLVVAGYEGMMARESRIAVPARSRLREAAERVIQLYEDWGQPEKASAWKAKLGLTDLPADVFAGP